MKLSTTVLLICGAFAWAQDQAASPGSNLPTHQIVADDLVSVALLGSPELTRNVRVSADGTIRLPLLRTPIALSGLVPAEAEIIIAKAFQKEGIFTDPAVTVMIVEYRRGRPIVVSGAVRQPTTFQPSGPISLLDAITHAGGLSQEAGQEIVISHTRETAGSEALFRRIPVKPLFDGSNPELNIRLDGGEEIRVPESGRVFVLGNVRRPGAFRLQDSSDTTILKVLALSEGLAPYAAKEAYIYRQEGNGNKNEIKVDLAKIIDRKSPDVSLSENDILYIPDNKGRRLTMGAIERIIGFSAATGSGVLVYGAAR